MSKAGQFQFLGAGIALLQESNTSAMIRAMAHIGFLPVHAKGHMYPASSLALHLQQRGHRITFFCIADSAAFFQEYGLACVVVGGKSFPIGYANQVFEKLGKLKGQAGVLYTMKMFEVAMDMHFAELPAAIQASQVDGLVIDQFHMGGGAVADHLQLPYVHAAMALIFIAENGVPTINLDWGPETHPWARLRNAMVHALARRMLRPVHRKINAQRGAWGLAPHARYPNDVFAGHPQISQQPPSFEFPRRALPADFHFVGPLHSGKTRAKTEFPRERLDGRPILYASLGTLQNGLDWIFRVILAACEGLDAQLVLSLGGNMDPAGFLGTAGNPIVVKFAPQLELLEQAALCITHAGLNTALESLACGVPMVAIPITNDQPGVAARIAWCGVGEFVTPRRLTVPRLRAVIQKVWSTPAYRENAQRLQREIAGLHSLDYASDVIEAGIHLANFRKGEPGGRDWLA
jgi:zeaxanthin glucosyltransferase